MAFKCMRDGGAVGSLGPQAQVEVVQAMVILSGTLRRLAKWAGAYGTTDGAIRFAALAHLNVGPGFESLMDDYTPSMRVQPTLSSKQEEARRNTFWMCYVGERYYARLSGYAMSVVDVDVSQALPLRGDSFEQGIDIPRSERQYAHSPNILLNHPPELTDSFVLMVKSAILLSRVVSFNRRFRQLNFLGVSEMCVEESLPQHLNAPSASIEGSLSRKKTPDARRVDGFLKLENDTESFTSSFPAYLQEPINQDGSVDWTLLNAYLASDCAKMMLHEPHADLRLNEADSETNDFACKSARKVVEALDDAYHLLRNMTDSVPDVTLSDPYCSSTLFHCSATCFEIIQKSLRNSPTSEDEIVRRPRFRVYWEKFKYMRSTLRKIGVRLPQAEVQASVLDDLVRRLLNPDRGSS